MFMSTPTGKSRKTSTAQDMWSRMTSELDERRLFGTNGVRGIVNKDLTLELVLELSQAIGTFFKGGRMVVG
ncbi:MAG: hypothetical protein WCC94_03435, partial [Candidatus Bathyarchaeia archaeon]